MLAATPGVSTFFTLGIGAPTQVAGWNDQRRYLLITNNDKNNAVAWANGTNNAATANHHVIPPGSWYVFGPVRPGRALGGDISAIVISGTPTISYVEL